MPARGAREESAWSTHPPGDTSADVEEANDRYQIGIEDKAARPGRNRESLVPRRIQQAGRQEAGHGEELAGEIIGKAGLRGGESDGVCPLSREVGVEKQHLAIAA